MATKGMVMEERNLRKTRTGKVVSNKMDKTIVVAVENNGGASSSRMRYAKPSVRMAWFW